MHLQAWAIASLTSVIASSIPFVTSYGIHLPYLPSTGQGGGCDSYLTLEWTIINGSLYANEDRMFPPSTPMQLRAPWRESPSKIFADQVILSYSLEARPLSTDENGGTSRIVRVRVHLLSLEGRPITPNTVVLDLLTGPDGSQHITRVRLEPRKSHHAGHNHGDRPWPIKFWESQVAAPFKKSSSPSLSEDKLVMQMPVAEATANTTPDSGTRSQPRYISSYLPFAYSRSCHRLSSHREDNRTFVRHVSPVILLALLAAAAGLVVWLVGYIVGSLAMLISVRLGLRKVSGLPSGRWDNPRKDMASV